jgi:hypothetical protein
VFFSLRTLELMQVSRSLFLAAPNLVCDGIF